MLRGPFRHSSWTCEAREEPKRKGGRHSGKKVELDCLSNTSGPRSYLEDPPPVDLNKQIQSYVLLSSRPEKQQTAPVKG